MTDPASTVVTFQQALLFSNLPEYESKNVKLLWHYDYYDGPLSGLVDIGQPDPVWFQMVEERCYQLQITSENTPSPDGDIEHLRVRRMALVALHPDQMSALRREHELFRKYVGTHTEYVDGKRNVGATAPPSEHHKFYDRPESEKYKLNIDSNPVIGYFDW